MELKVRLLRAGSEDEILVLLDEGQDFEGLFAAWCHQDDLFCDDQLGENEWQDARTFLIERGVTVIDATAVDNLADYYGLL